MVQRLGSTYLLKTTFIHDRYLIRHNQCFGLIMSDVDKCCIKLVLQ